jgi:enoyl-CoA hydratase/3-hydroxyacyl-CoA dehydrogenase
LERGVAVIVSNVKRLLKRRKMNLGAMEFILRNLHPQTNWDGFDQVDCVIEAAVENIKIKQNIFEKLEKACPNASILATNTSTIDLNEVGLKMQSKSKLVGLHFFSPAHIMPLLEIIRIEDTSEQCIATCMTLAKKIKKTPVLVKNCVGFTANRMFFPYGQAGCLLLEHGISPYRIDKALETFGMPMGVFKMCDLSGLDISVHVGGIMRSAYGERSYGSKANDQLVNAKRLGQKNGLGWYDYKKNRPVPNPKVVAPLIAQAQAEAKVPASRIEKASKSLSDADLVEILLFTIANEGFRILDEGLAIREGDIDVCSVAGYGFPSVRGGVIKHARTSGLKYVVDRLNFYANFFEEQRIRNFFAPCARLVQEAKNSRT